MSYVAKVGLRKPDRLARYRQQWATGQGIPLVPYARREDVPPHPWGYPPLWHDGSYWGHAR